VTESNAPQSLRQQQAHVRYSMWTSLQPSQSQNDQQGQLKEAGAGRRSRESHHLRRHGEVKTLILIQDGGKSSGTVTAIDSARS